MRQPARPPAPCLLYARVSSERQDDAAQLALVRECIASHGDDLRAEHVEKETASGKATRVEWQRMIAALRRKPMRVHAYQLDRLTRNFADQAVLADLVQSGVEVHLCRPGKWWTPETDYDEEFAYDIETAIAKRYLANLRAETTKGMRHKAATGGWPGLAPFGYVNRRSERDAWIEPDPERAPLVPMIFRWAAAKHSHAEIARLAAAAGFRSRRGDAKLGKTKIARILGDRAYLGEVTWSLPPGQPGPPGKHQPLVTLEEWTAAHEAMGWTRRKAGRKRKGEQPDVWFRGLVSCGCGSMMTPDGPKAGRHGRGAYYYLRCARRCGEKPISEPALLQSIGGILAGLALSDKMRADLRKAIHAAGAKAAEVRAVHESKMHERRRRALHALDVLHSDRVDGKIRPEVYAIREARLSAELDAAAAGLASLDIASAENRTLALRLVDVAASLAIPTVCAEQPGIRRQIVTSVLSNPVIRGGELSAGFAEPFDLLAVAATRQVRRGGKGSAKVSGGSRPEPLREPLVFLAAVARHADRVRALVALVA